MTRIIYSWVVEPENLNRFIEIWKSTTNKIHKEVDGARGSFMLQNNEDPKAIKTVAKWASLNDWKKFWHESKHTQMQSMHELGERISVETYEEIDDHTK